MKRIQSLVLLTLFTFSLLLPASASARIEWENNATSLVASDITSGSTSVIVTTGQGDRFPAVTAPHYFMMTLIDVSGNREIVKVTARSAGSNTLTIVRAQEGTAAQAFAAGSYVDQRITKHSLDNFSQTYEQFVNYSVCDASAVDQADTVNSNSLASLAATIGTSLNATIVLPHTGTGNTTAYNVLQNLDLSTYGNITFIVNRGAVITHGANTVDMPAPQTGIYQIFSGAGAVTFNTNLGTTPQWFGTEYKGADIASANALVLGSDGNYFDVTGTTTITSIGTMGVAGFEATLQFDGILTLTHHATDLVLPGGANITTAAGDEAEFKEYEADKWRCTNYTKASGFPVQTEEIEEKAIRDISRGLIVKTNTGDTDHDIDIDADESALTNSSNVSYKATSVNLTMVGDASVGANALDAGSLANNTWYYLWVIYNGSTVASLGSTSSTAPTMPSGYTYKALVGAMITDGSANFLGFYQRGVRVRCNSGDTGSLTSTSAASLDISSFVPTTATLLYGNIRNSINSSRVQLHPVTFSAGQGTSFMELSPSSSGVDQQYIVPIETSQTIYYAVSAGTTVIRYWGWEY